MKGKVSKVTRMKISKALIEYHKRTKRPRDVRGRFTKITRIIRERFKKYIYIVSFTYPPEKIGKRGSHPFHCEVRFESPSPDETLGSIFDFIADMEEEYPLDACDIDWKVMGYEIEEVSYEVVRSYKILEYTIRH